MNAFEALKLVGETEFRPFTKSDWQAFSGCQTENPMIGENGNWAIIIDGEEICFLDDNSNWFNFKLNLTFAG